MSLKPIQQSYNYAIQISKGLRTVWATLTIDPKQVLVNFEKDANKYELKDLIFQQLSPSNQDLPLVKRSTAQLTTQPFDIRGAAMIDLYLASIGYKIPINTEFAPAFHMNSQQEVEICFLNTFVPLLKFKGSDQAWILRLETIYGLSVKKETDFLLGFKFQTTTNNCESILKFETEKQLQQCIDNLQKAVKYLGRPALPIQEMKAQEELSEVGQKFEADSYNITVQKPIDSMFSEVRTVGAPTRVQICINNETLQNTLKQQTVPHQVIQLNRIWSVTISEQIKIGPVSTPAEKTTENKTETEPKTSAITTAEITEDDNFPLMIETITGEKLIYNFSTLAQCHSLAVSILDKMTVNSLPVNLRFFIPNNLRVNPYLMPINSQLVEQFISNCQASGQPFVRNLLVLIEAHPRSLPIDSKMKELVQNCLYVLKSSISRNEKLVVIEGLRLAVTSRTLFRAIVEDFGGLLIPVLEQTIKEHKHDSPVLASTLILLRSIVTYQWRPNQIDSGASYTGTSAALTTGLAYKEYQNVFKGVENLEMKELKQSQKYFFSDLELQAFSSKGISETSSAAASLGLHSSYQQGKNYTSSRIEAERDNRADLFTKQTSCLPLIGALISKFDQIKSPLIQMSLIGILEDVIVTKSHVDQKFFQDQLKQALKAGQQLLPQPVGRKDLMLLAFESLSGFIDLSVMKNSYLHNSVTMIIRQMLYEDKVLSMTIRNEICQTLLCSGALVSQILFMVQDSDDYIEKIIAANLIAACYAFDKNVQQLLKKIFPTAFIAIADKMLKPAALTVEDYSNIVNPFCFTLAPFKEFLQQIHTQKYAINIVWDIQLRQALSTQLQQINAEFEQQKLFTDKISWNYEEMRINLRSCSASNFSQFDIDIGPVVLSQLINLGVDGLNAKIGADNSIEYYKFLRSQRLQYLKQNVLGKKEIIESNRYQQEIAEETGVEVKLGSLMKANLQGLDINQLMNQLFDRYITNSEDVPQKCACLYCIQMISMIQPVKFMNILQLSQEAVRSIREGDFMSVLYELCLLECACNQVNKEDIQSRSFWNLLSKTDLIYYICTKILPLLLYENGKINVNQPLEPFFELINQPCYGNLVTTSLRILIQCVRACPSTDINGAVLVPTPNIYKIIQSQAVLPTLLGLLLICWKSEKFYESVDVENKIYKDDLGEESEEAELNASTKVSSVFKTIKRIRPKIKINQDFYESIFMLTCQLIQDLCIQSEQTVQYFINAGFIEFALANPLSAKANEAVFKMLKEMSNNKQAEMVIRKLLPKPVVNYLRQSKHVTPMAEVFCSHNFVTMNCIWTKQMRQHLRDSLKSIVDSLDQALVGVTRSDIEAQMYNVKEFVENQNCFIPMIWYDNIDQHPVITDYPMIGPHEKYCLGGIYIDLIDIVQFCQLFQETTSLSIDQNRGQVEFQRKSKIIRNLDQIVQDRHNQMLKNIEQALNLQECIDILVQLIDCQQNATTGDIYQKYTQNNFGQLGDITQPYLLDATNFIMEICLKKIQDEVLSSLNLHKTEQNVRIKMKQFAQKTGGTGIAVLKQDESLKHPDLLRAERLEKLNTLFKFISVLGVVYKCTNEALLKVNNNFQSIDISILSGLLMLAPNLAMLSIKEKAKSLIDIAQDFESNDELNIVDQISNDFSENQLNLTKQMLSLASKMIMDSIQQTELRISYVKCLQRLMFCVNQQLNQETLSFIQEDIVFACTTLLQKRYKSTYSLKIEEEKEDQDVLMNNIITTVLTVVKKIVQIKEGASLMNKYNLVGFIIKLVLEQKPVASEILQKMTFADQNVQRIANKCMTLYLTQLLMKQAEIINNVNDVCYSEKVIYNNNILVYLQNQLNNFCANVNIMDHTQIFTFANTIDVDSVLQSEFKVKQYYIVSVIGRIISNNLLKGETFYTSITGQLHMSNVAEDMKALFDKENLQVALIEFILQFARVFLQIDFTLSPMNYTTILKQTMHDQYTIYPFMLCLSLLSYLYQSSSDISAKYQMNQDLCKLILILAIQESGAPEHETVAELAASMLVHMTQVNNQCGQLLPQAYPHIIKLLNSPFQPGLQSIIGSAVPTPEDLKHVGYELGYRDSQKLGGFYKLIPTTILSRSQMLLQCLTNSPITLKNFEVIALNILLENCGEAKTEQDNFNQKVSFEQLGKQLQTSTFLQNMLPLPFQLSLVQKDITLFQKMLKSVSEVSEFIWNATVCKEFVTFVGQLNQQVIQNADQDYQIETYTLQTSLKSLYSHAETYVGGVYIEVYNHLSTKVHVNVSQPKHFITKLSQKLLEVMELSEDKTYLITQYLQAIANLLKQQPRLRLLFQNDTAFKQALSKLLFDSGFNCGFAYNQENARKIAGQTTELLSSFVQIEKIFSVDQLTTLFFAPVLKFSNQNSGFIVNQFQFVRDLEAFMNLSDLTEIAYKLVSAQLLRTEVLRLQLQRTKFGQINSDDIYLTRMLFEMFKSLDCSKMTRFCIGFNLIDLVKKSSDAKREFQLMNENDMFKAFVDSCAKMDMKFSSGTLTEGVYIKNENEPVPLPNVDLNQILNKEDLMDLASIEQAENQFTPDIEVEIKNGLKEVKNQIGSSIRSIFAASTDKARKIVLTQDWKDDWHLKRAVVISMQYAYVCMSKGQGWSQISKACE
ncbi:Conserved_hypothetical protein [Hexamita inflata]|uniref:Uncharacterized protein n=1 Tax=Hexamita inflata TaxID=28002 RepID=A0AA86UZR8_9EUKA|nr:Conserved hypothetical protein [Hexamita inflata]